MDKLERSFLFVPGDRPELFNKALATGADMIIVDLEDAVAPASKEHARECVDKLLKAGGVAMVRINPVDTNWFEDDLLMVSSHSPVAVLIPKAEPKVVKEVVRRLSKNTDIYALIETVDGFVQVRQVANVSGVHRLVFGNVDFGIDSGIEETCDELNPIRLQLVIESRSAKIPPPIDGVSLALKDVNVIAREAQRSRRLGFGGKLCIHPQQVPIVNDAFRPSKEDVDKAIRILSAMEESKGGVVALDGKMLDRPVFEWAQRILAEADIKSKSQSIKE